MFLVFLISSSSGNHIQKQYHLTELRFSCFFLLATKSSNHRDLQLTVTYFIYMQTPTKIGTICTNNGGGGPPGQLPSNSTGSTSLHQSMDIHSPGSSTSKIPNVATSMQPPLPDGMKVRRLRLSQLNLFASGRGTTAPVPIRPAADSPHSPQHIFSPSPVHKSKGIPNAHVLPVGGFVSKFLFRLRIQAVFIAICR